jgi:hypothetical protein
VTKKELSSHTKSHTAAIVVGIIGGAAAAISAVIGIVAFVQRRRRRGRPRSIVLSLSDFMETDSRATMGTPSNPIPFEAAEDSGTWAERQPLVSEVPEAEMGARITHLRQVAPILVGLSDKELARLRADTLSSEQSQNSSTSNVSQSTPSPNTGTGSGEATSPNDPRRLQSEVEFLRREMERLRAEGSAPPSYTEGDE